MKITEILNAIANISSSNSKKEILKTHGSNETFKKVLFYALNPYYTFGVVKLPKISRCGNQEFSHETFVLLDQLRARTITGGNAITAICEHMYTLDEDHQKVFKQILDKDLRAGMSGKTVNAVFPNLIPSFAIMLAEKYEESRLKFPCLAERKMDGVRCVIEITPTNIEFYSRAGKVFHCFEHMKPMLAKLFSSEVFKDTLMLDGEVISSTFNKVVSSVHKKDYQFTDGIFSVFDVINFDMSQIERRQWLESMVMDSEFMVLTPQRIMHSVEEIDAFYDECLAQGYEGVVVKDPNGLYENKRSYCWMKVKPKETHDVTIIGTYEGTGKNEGSLGGFICSDGTSPETHRVGSGFSDEQRAEFWAERENLIGRMIEIEVQEKLITGGFRHSRFKRFRDTITSVKE